MGNKTNHITSLRFSKPHVNHSDGVHKKVHKAKPLRVGKKAKELLKKNFSFFSNMNSFNTFLKLNSQNSLCTRNDAYRLPVSNEEDATSHQYLVDYMSLGIGLHAHPDFQTKKTTELMQVPVDGQPHTWRDSLPENHISLYGFSQKQAKYQEILYEIILTEQCYVDDLILIYEIFIKEAIGWNGLLFPVERLFKSIKRIIALHLGLLEDLRTRQFYSHPVLSTITDIFDTYVHEFKLYFSYFREFEKATTLIQKSINRQDELGAFISRRSAWLECKNLPFSAYLLKPIQRIMKYPLFFKSLSDCLLSNDPEMPRTLCFLAEIDKLLRCFEKEKKEAEDFMKLEDLSCRIKGLEGSTIHIAEPKRKLIYEGYLTIIPQSNQPSSFSRMSSSTVSFASTADTPRLRRRNSTFNIASKKQDRAYVFLFNDLIVCTRERNKRKPVSLDERGSTIGHKKGTFYGPSADSLFEIIHAPGKITMLDRHVVRETNMPPAGKLSRKGSGFFQSFKRYGSRVMDDESYVEEPIFCSQQSLTSIKREDTIEEHPLQFVCSIATKNLTNVQFEAETVEEKSEWCDRFESVLKDHVQRDCSSSLIKSPSSSDCPSNDSFLMDTEFSILDKQMPSLAAEDDKKDGMAFKLLHNETLPTLINRLTIFNDNNDFYNSLLSDFGGQPWGRK